MNPIYIKVWGCRGSFPAPFSDRMEFGGNTACISLEYGERILVLDAGSGIVPLGRQIDWTEKKKRVDIFISHVHVDHIMGLYLFQPLFDPEMEIHIYGASQGGVLLRHLLENVISPPYWPLGIQSLPAKVEYHEVEKKDVLELFPDITVDIRASNHPGGSLNYRFHVGRRYVLYGTDCEMDDSIWDELVSSGKDCDLLICDAQYRPEELALKKGWGHSSWKEGNKLLEACNAGEVLHTHFDWDAADDELRERERLAVGEQPRAIFAREGLVLRL